MGPEWSFVVLYSLVDLDLTVSTRMLTAAQFNVFIGALLRSLSIRNGSWPDSTVQTILQTAGGASGCPIYVSAYAKTCLKINWEEKASHKTNSQITQTRRVLRKGHM